MIKEKLSILIPFLKRVGELALAKIKRLAERAHPISTLIKGWSKRKKATVASVIACIGLLLVARPAIMVQIAAPQIIYAFPGQNGQEVPLDTSVQITFNKKVVKKSAEASLTIEPKLQGSYEWKNEYTLVFKPQQKLEKATRYTYKFSLPVLQVFGLPFISKEEVSFETEGGLKVLSYAPVETAQDSYTPIVVVFNRPMIEISTYDEEAGKESPIVISPEIPGKGSWLGSSAYKFTPTEPYKNSTNYSVTPRSNMKSLDGETFVTSFGWKFASNYPELISSTPEDQTRDIPLNQPIILTFNQDVRPESLKNALQITKNGSPQSYSVGKSWAQKNSYQILITNGLTKGARYYFNLAQGVTPAQGELTSVAGKTWSFTSVTDPAITQTYPANGENNADNVYSVSIYFNSKMDIASIKNSLVINPKPENFRISDCEDYCSLDNYYINLNGDFKAETEYKIKIGRSAKSTYGYTLTQDFTYWFKTAPLAPSIGINANDSYFMSFSANLEPKVILNTINVSGLTYSLYKLPLEEFIKLYRLRYDYEYAKTVCGNNYACENWQTYEPALEKIKDWTSSIAVKKNEKVVDTQTLTDIAGNKLQPGLYFLQIKSTDTGIKDNAVLIVSNTALTLKKSSKQVFVWAVDQGSANPQSNKSIKILGNNGNVLGEGKTNSDGVYKVDAEVANEKNIFAVMYDSNDFSVVTSNFDLGISRYEFGDFGYGGNSMEYKTHIFTDLPLYRPGETILFKGLLKSYQNNSYQTLADKDVSLVITDSQGQTIFSKSYKTSGDGSFNGQYALSPQTTSGNYYISTKYGTSTYGQDFQVEEYRKAEFFLDITPDKDSFSRGETNYVTINTSYYFGAPIVNKLINYTIKTKDSSFVWNKGNYYDFEDSTYISYYWDRYDPASDYDSGEKLLEGSGYTNTNGDLRVALPKSTTKKVPQKIVVEASVEDINNQASAGSKEITMHLSNFYIGLKPTKYVYSIKDTAKVNVVTVNQTGKEVGNKKITAKIYKRTWDVIKEKDPDTGNYQYTSKPTDTFLKEKSLQTNEWGYGELAFEPETGGIYKILAESTDSGENKVSSSTTLWVAGEGYQTLRSNNDRINIITDKAEYKVGETAKVFADSPYKEGARSLVTVEQDGVTSYFLANTGGGAPAFDLKIDASFFPNAYVSVIAPKAGAKVESPAEFKIGYTPIKVIDDTKKVEVSIKTDREVYGPRDKVVLELTTKTKDGKPVSTDISLVVSDRAVWDMSTTKQPDIYDYFYASRPLNVATANLLTISVDRININVEKGSKGGGGGESKEFFETTRTKFLNTAYWLPNIQTNSDGYAKTEFELPDNLTTWKIEGRAQSNLGQFGQGETSTKSSKEYLLRPFVPRFLSTGDRVEMGAILMNQSTQNIKARVSLEGQGFTLSQDSFKDVTLAPNEQKKVLFPALITATDTAALKVGAQSNGVSLDSVELTIPIKNHYALQATSTFGEVKSSVTEKLYIPDTVVTDLGTVDFKVFSNPSLQSLSAYSYMHDYLYSCTEQTSSKLLSNLSLYKVQKAYKSDMLLGYKQAYLEALIGQDIQTLLARQLYDGGWTWWSADTYDRTVKASPELSAYVYYVLNQAKENGFTVAQGTVEKGKNYLIAQQENAFASRFVDYNTLAYLLYSVGGEYVNNYAIGQLISNKRELSLEAKAYLADYLFQTSSFSNNQQAGTLENELLATPKISDTLVNWEEPGKYYPFFGSDISTTASIVNFLNKYNSNHPYIDRALRYIAKSKQGGNFWISTKTTSLVLEAVANRAVGKSSGNNKFGYKVLLGTNELLTGEFTSQNLLDVVSKSVPVKDIKQNASTDVKFEKSGPGNFYYEMSYRYFLKDKKVKPVENGMSLIRQFIDDAGKSVDLTKLKEKDMFWVKLTLVVPSTRKNVLIEDFFPAGLESINMNLANSQVLAGVKPKELDSNAENGGWWYSQARTEYKDDVTAFFIDYLYPGVYEYSYKVRATTPGDYVYAPASAYEMYTPDIFGNSAGSQVVVSVGAD